MTKDTPSSSHANVAHYWRLIDAFNRNDLSVVSELLDPEITYSIPGRSPIAGETRGIKAHLESLKLARERSGNTLKLEPRAVLANDDYLLVYGRISAERGDKRLDSDHCVLFRFVNGRIVEGKTVPTDLYAFDAFWS